MWVKIISPEIYLKSVSNRSTAVSLKNPPKSVSDTGNPYHVAGMSEVTIQMQLYCNIGTAAVL